MDKKDKGNLYQLFVLLFNLTILLICIRTRKSTNYVICLKEIYKRLREILSAVFYLKCSNPMSGLKLSISFKLKKSIKHLRFGSWHSVQSHMNFEKASVKHTQLLPNGSTTQERGGETYLGLNNSTKPKPTALSCCQCGAIYNGIAIAVVAASAIFSHDFS